MYNPPPSAGYADIETGTHLLWDSRAVADTFRLRRVAHQPVPDPAEPIFVAEHPADGNRVTVRTVRYDADAQRWRMWYVASDPEARRAAQALGQARYETADIPKPSYVCYAESDDGVNWRRGSVNRFAHPAGDNPIVFQGFHGASHACVFEVPGAPPEQRYAMACMEWIRPGDGGIMFARSSDGIQWDYPPDVKPVIFGHSDCLNDVLYNPERGVFMLYPRAWHAAAEGWTEHGKGNKRRRVSYAESVDLVTWSEPQVIITPDELDTNDFYGLAAHRIQPHRYFGQLKVYDEEQTAEIRCEPAFSDDGIHWWRLPERSEFIPLADRGDGMPRMILPTHELVEHGDDIYVYHCADMTQHDDTTRDARTYRGRLRRDGFVSLRAGRPMGTLVTRPFTVTGERITINARCFGGRIEAALVEPDPYDPAGRPIEGFSAAEFDTFAGDDVRHVLSWSGRADLSTLRGRRLMLRMALNHAELYSFTL